MKIEYNLELILRNQTRILSQTTGFFFFCGKDMLECLENPDINRTGED